MSDPLYFVIQKLRREQITDLVDAGIDFEKALDIVQLTIGGDAVKRQEIETLIKNQPDAKRKDKIFTFLLENAPTSVLEAAIMLIP